MLIYGAGGHAKVIIDSLECLEIELIAIFDDDSKKKHILSYDILGAYNPLIFTNEKIIIAIGDNSLRREITNCIEHKFVNVIHPSALVSKYASLGDGNALLQGCVVQAGVKIGSHVIINTKANVDHDCEIANFAHIAPNVTLCGGVLVGEGTFIGASSVVIPSIKIGKWAIIGAGSVIVDNVPDYAVVMGNPGRIKKYIDYGK